MCLCAPLFERKVTKMFWKAFFFNSTLSYSEETNINDSSENKRPHCLTLEIKECFLLYSLICWFWKKFKFVWVTNSNVHYWKFRVKWAHVFWWLTQTKLHLEFFQIWFEIFLFLLNILIPYSLTGKNLLKKSSWQTINKFRSVPEEISLPISSENLIQLYVRNFQFF